VAGLGGGDRLRPRRAVRGLAIFKTLGIGRRILLGRKKHVTVFDRDFAFRFATEHSLLLGLSWRDHPNGPVYLTGILSVPIAYFISVTTGVIAVAYTSMGGLRADLLQFSLLFIGAVVSVAVVSVSLGGFSWILTQWRDNWDVQPVLSLDPQVRATVVGAIVMQLVFRVCTAEADQTMVQRFMATSSASSARRAFLIQSIAAVIVTLFLGLLVSHCWGTFATRLCWRNRDLILVRMQIIYFRFSSLIRCLRDCRV